MRPDEKTTVSTLEARSAERRRRIAAHRAATFAEAAAWDLEFWQRCSPDERLSALVALRRQVQLIEVARASRRPA